MKVYFCGLPNHTISQLTALFTDFNKNGVEIQFSNISTKSEILSNNTLQIYFCIPESLIDGDTGIDFAKIIRKKDEKAIIIFLSKNLLSVTTILKKYICPAGYFLFDELSEAVKFSINILEQRMLVEKDMSLKIKIVSEYKKIAVSLNNIIYFVSCNKKIVCQLTNGKKIEFYGTLTNIEKSYKDIFLRCHSGYLINKWKIVSINYTQNYIELLNSNEIVPISRKYRSNIKQFIDSSEKEEVDFKLQ